MIDKTIVIYKFIDDLLKYLNHKEDKKRKLSDAEVLTTAIIAALYFGGDIENARSFMATSKLITNMLDKSRFNRRLHARGEKITLLFLEIGQHIKQVAYCHNFIIASFSVEVCDNIRISKSKLVKGEEYRGWKASMGRYFYDIKVQLLTTANVIPVEFCFVPGSQADIK